jgi:hypothetical protein
MTLSEVKNLTEEPENKKLEQQEDTEVVTKAMRPPRSGVTERLVCQSLFQGTFSDLPSKMIDHLCVAAMGCAKLMKDESETLPYDLDEINRIYTLNMSFMNVVFSPYGLDRNRTGEQVASIPWGFAPTEENYKLYILPWRNNLPLNFFTGYIRGFRKQGAVIRHTNTSYNDGPFSTAPNYCSYEFARATIEDAKAVLAELQEEYAQCPMCHRYLGGQADDHLELQIGNIMNPEPEWEFFFVATKCLTEDSARNLRNAFQHWAIPKLENAKMEMALFVSPQTYEDIAKLFMGEKEEHDNRNGNGKPELQS